MAVPRGCDPRTVPISLVAVHTAEGATTTASLAAFLDQPGTEASYHVLADDGGAVRYLNDTVAAWAMLSGNARSVQICLTGFAAWPRSEWLAHDSMLRIAAAWVRSWCLKYNLPMRKLTPAEVGADAQGVCGHWDWTLGKRDGTHTDPGPAFPWDVFMGYVNSGGATPSKGNTVENHRIAGKGLIGLGCPVGKASSILGSAWISAFVDGPANGHVRYWFQNDTGGISDAIHDIAFANGHSARAWEPVPDGTTMIRVEYDVGTGGTVFLETASK